MKKPKHPKPWAIPGYRGSRKAFTYRGARRNASFNRPPKGNRK